MIWTKLLFLALAVYVCDSVGSPPKERLVYAFELRGSVYVNSFDLRLNEQQMHFFLSKQEGDMANIFLSGNKNELFLYWSLKNSPLIGRYQFSKNKKETKKLGAGKNIFLGVGDDEKIYLYSPSSKNILVYDYNSGLKLEELGGLRNTDMHCADVDPTHKDEIFFAECSGNKFIGRVYEVSEKALQKDYEQALPTCFDTWRITPNGEKAIAVSGDEIYVSSYEGAPFFKYHTANDTVVGFAPGNDVIFYSTKANKIFQVVKGYDGKIYERSVPVPGPIKAMAIYVPPKKYLAYAAVRYGTTIIYKTDFEFRQTIELRNFRMRGMTVNKMYFGHDDWNEVLYWTCETAWGQNYVQIYSESFEGTVPYFGGVYQLMGIGYNYTMYFYIPRNKTLLVYSQNYTNSIQNGLKNSATDMHCMTVDPRNKEQIFFAECTGNKSVGKVYDVKEQKVLENYNQPLPVCFNTWGITPNGRKAYAVYKNKIYLSSKEGAPFKEYALVDGDIRDFAVGNNELFYTIKQSPRKIFKLMPAKNRDGYFTSEFNAKDDVKALAVYEE